MSVARALQGSGGTDDVGRVAVGQTPATGIDREYVRRNRAAWDTWAPAHLAAGRRAWTRRELMWGVWSTHESRLGLVTDVARDHDVVELGCGTAEVSAFLAERGARPVAVDVSQKQVANVQVLQTEFGLRFPVVCANAEEVPYADESFDVAISEYGASLWCDPHHWLVEANRLLRPGGRLVFFANAPLLVLCTPDGGGQAGERLMRDYFTAPEVEFDRDGPVEFHPTHSAWVRHLRSTGFVLDDLIEIRPRTDDEARFPLASVEWARRWPSEEVWVARKAT